MSEPASIVLDDVHVEYHLYGLRSRSLKQSFLNLTSAGRLAKDAKSTSLIRALQGISLTFGEGDRIGLIGGNGAGKSTLLRVLGGSLRPARGRVRRVGTISSLFDVTVGMNIEMTGWDNIIMRGLFLGLSTRQIRKLIPEIAEFSGLGDDLYRPVHTYSSGMLLRLAFAASTAVNPEILLMDEWIGVGDADFMVKTQRRLTDMVEQAKIMVLASHSTELLASLCTRLLWLREGRIVMDGPVNRVLDAYHHGHPA